MNDVETGRRVLARAATLLGGVEMLSARLGVGRRVLHQYLVGTRPLPDDLLLAAIDVILEHVPVPPETRAAPGLGALPE